MSTTIEMQYCPVCKSDLKKEFRDGMNRICCSNASCEYVFWDNPTPVVAGIVEIDNKVVLARNALWPKDFFGLIAGFLERGETPEQGIVREVKEELNLDGEISSFVGHYSFFERNQIIFAYHLTAKGKILIGEELAEVKLVPPEEIVPWEKGTGPALKDWLKSRCHRKRLNE